MEQLIVRLPRNDDQQIEWIIVNGDDQTVGAPNQGSLEDILPMAKKYPIHLIISCRDVALFTIELPPMPAKKRYQALPYALEDKVIAPIETQHVALGNAVGPSQYSVAVMARDIMNTVIAPWKEFDLQSIVPDCLLLSPHETNWHLFLENDNALVQLSKQRGFYCEADNIPMELDNLIKQTDPAQLPKKISIIHVLSKKPVALQQSAAIEIEQQLLTKAPIEYLAQVFIKANPINLLQGDYKQRGEKQNWRYALLALGSLVLLTVCYTITAWISYQAQLKKAEEQVAVVYKRIFPQATKIISPQARVEQKLHELPQSDHRIAFFSTLSDINHVFKDSPNSTILNLYYQHNDFTLDIRSQDFGSLESLVTALKDKGLTVTQQHADSQNNTITAKLQVTR